MCQARARSLFATATIYGLRVGARLAGFFPLTGPAGRQVLPATLMAVSWSRNSISRWFTKRDFISGLGGEPFSRPAVEAREASWGKKHLSAGLVQVGVQESLWRKFFSDPTQWWDNRRSKEGHPHFRHKMSEEALWLNNLYKPAWVEWHLSMLDSQVVAGLRRPPRSVYSSVQAPSSKLAVNATDSMGEACRKLCECGQLSEAVDALKDLVQRECDLDTNLIYSVLKRCIAQKDLLLGSRVHAISVENGYEGNAFLATHLIRLYASHGRFQEAMGVFSKVSTPDAYLWASIISACAKHGEPTRAVGLYREMRESTVKPDNRVFVAVLKACVSAGDLAAGQDVHAHILASAGKPDMFVQNSLIHMYAKCGILEDARRVFDMLPHKNVVTWNTMITGYAQQGMSQEALCLYSGMQHEGITKPDSVTFACLLQACASIAALTVGRQLHAQIEERQMQAEVVVCNSLVNMYAKCGSVEDARRVFDRLSQKDVVTWNAMIAGYAGQGMGQEALSLYRAMQQDGLTCPNSVTFVCLLQASASVAALPVGKQIHVQIEERGMQADVTIGNSLVNMYVKCGSVEDGQRVFDGLSEKNVVTWNAMIAGYAQQGMGQAALSLYDGMQAEGITQPDSVTFVALLQACASMAALRKGEQLHAQIEERGLQADMSVGSSLVNMYAKCGCLKDAQRVFDRLLQKNVVTWNAMIAGYAQQGMGQQALSLYSRMQQESTIKPNSATFASLLQACASVSALPLGKQLHAEIEECGLQADLTVSNSLVNMYAKCGSQEDALQVFNSLPKREIMAWGALIAGYARQGDSQSVFNLLDRMTLEGTQPDSISFLSVLTVCSHMGLVDKGRKYFEAMSTDYGITPTIEHYTCMIDLLSRAGHLDMAVQMVKALPYQSTAAVWLTLLGACQKWSNVEVGRQAFEFAVRLDEKDPAAYVLMSNIYAGVQMWEEANDMQARRKRCGAWKQPGQSCWTDMDGVVHRFVGGDGKVAAQQDNLEVGRCRKLCVGG